MNPICFIHCFPQNLSKVSIIDGQPLSTFASTPLLYISWKELRRVVLDTAGKGKTSHYKSSSDITSKQ